MNDYLWNDLLMSGGLAGLQPATANPNLWAQGLRAREQERKQLEGYEAGQMAGMVPGLGLLGILGDAQQYVEKPETRGILNYGLTALGALPFFGAMAKMAGPMPRGVLQKEAGAIAWHGSPESFSKFDMSKSGRGDRGGTSFGLGINLSADPKHASAYRGPGGHMYKVDLPDEEIKKFIKWESPVNKEIAQQVPKIDFSKPIPFGGGATIENVDGSWRLKSGDSSFRLSEKEVYRMFGDENTGEQIYRRLVASLGDERTASNWLRQRGVRGIVNTTERDALNYTVFDDSLPKILERR